MASVRWNREFYDYRTRLGQLPNTMRDVAVRIVNESVKEGAEIMYDKVNRVDTEHMKGSVSYEDARSAGKTVKGKFGWGLHGSKVEPYFIYQEQGFTHAYSGKDIAPMHALFDAFRIEKEKFYERILEALKK